jgi:hypothetical protein
VIPEMLVRMVSLDLLVLQVHLVTRVSVDLLVSLEKPV